MVRVRILIEAIAFLLLPALALAQTAPDDPYFEAASVKSVQPQMRGAYFHADAGRLDYHLVELRSLILAAYPLPWFRVVWPEWLNGQPGPKFDISAIYGPGTTKATLRLMLQALLAERFALVVHRETQDKPVYALTIADSGLRIQKTKTAGGEEAGLNLVPARSIVISREGHRLTDSQPNR